MLEDAGDEVIAERAHPVAPFRIVHQRPPIRRIPETEVDVPAIAGLIDERLRRERRVEPVTMRHPAHRLAIEHLTIGGIQRGGVTDRELLLPMSELRIVL